LHSDELKEYHKDILNLLLKLGREIGAATRQRDDEKWEMLDNKIQALKPYNKRVKSIIDNLQVMGYGLNKIAYGKYLIDKKKLGKGILSISYPNGRKVNAFPNKHISDGVKKVLLNNKINKNYDLTEPEKIFLRNFIDKSEAEVSKSKKRAVCNRTWERMVVLSGEIKAGNTSPVVKNELADIAHYFYKKNELEKPQYQKILSLI
jgi:hypothetical protein